MQGFVYHSCLMSQSRLCCFGPAQMTVQDPDDRWRKVSSWNYFWQTYHNDLWFITDMLLYTVCVTLEGLTGTAWFLARRLHVLIKFASNLLLLCHLLCGSFRKNACVPILNYCLLTNSEVLRNLYISSDWGNTSHSITEPLPKYKDIQFEVQKIKYISSHCARDKSLRN